MKKEKIEAQRIPLLCSFLQVFPSLAKAKYFHDFYLSIVNIFKCIFMFSLQIVTRTHVWEEINLSYG